MKCCLVVNQCTVHVGLYILFWLWQCLTRQLIELNLPWDPPSILVQLRNHTLISSWNQPVLSSGVSFLLNETTGAFDRAQTDDRHIRSQMYYLLRNVCVFQWWCVQGITSIAHIYTHVSTLRGQLNNYICISVNKSIINTNMLGCIMHLPTQSKENPSIPIRRNYKQPSINANIR